MDVPMLDDAEFAGIHALYQRLMRSKKDLATARNTSPDQPAAAAIFRPVLDEYNRITGFGETNHLAVLHHALSIYGPPCSHCGKPLRTPRARHCAACGSAA
jgi:hypothetical protein